MTSKESPEPPRPTARLLFAGAFFMLVLLAMLGQLYYLQVVQHSFWVAKTSSGSEVSVRVPAVHGEIRDRNGLTLAENRPDYAIEFYLPDMLRDYRATNKNVPPYEYYTTAS